MCVPVHCVCLVPMNTRRVLETLDLELHSVSLHTVAGTHAEEQSVLMTTGPPLSSAARGFQTVLRILVLGSTFINTFTRTPKLQRNDVHCSTVPNTKTKQPATRKIIKINHGHRPTLTSDTDNNDKLTWVHTLPCEHLQDEELDRCKSKTKIWRINAPLLKR